MLTWSFVAGYFEGEGSKAQNILDFEVKDASN